VVLRDGREEFVLKNGKGMKGNGADNTEFMWGRVERALEQRERRSFTSEENNFQGQEM